MKLLLGLARKSGGDGTVLGRPLGDRGARAPDRLPARAVPLPGLADRRRGAASSTPASPGCRGPPPGPEIDARARARRPRGPGPRPRRRLLQGHAAAARARGGAARRPGARHPRRAHVRAGPGGPRRRPRDHPRRPGPRLGGAAQLAPAGRGRAAVRPRRSIVNRGRVVAAGTLARAAGRAGGPAAVTDLPDGPLAAAPPSAPLDRGGRLARRSGPVDPERIPDVVAAVVAGRPRPRRGPGAPDRSRSCSSTSSARRDAAADEAPAA